MKLTWIPKIATVAMIMAWVPSSGATGLCGVVIGGRDVVVEFDTVGYLHIPNQPIITFERDPLEIGVTHRVNTPTSWPSNGIQAPLRPTKEALSQESHSTPVERAWADYVGQKVPRTLVNLISNGLGRIGNLIGLSEPVRVERFDQIFLSAHKKYAVTNSNRGNTRIYNATTGQLVHSLRDSAVSQRSILAVSGDYFAAIEISRDPKAEEYNVPFITVRSIQDPQKILVKHPTNSRTVKAVTFSRDEERVVTADTHGVTVHDVSVDNSIVSKYIQVNKPDPDLHGPTSISTATLVSGGKRLIVGFRASSDRQTWITVVDVKTGKQSSLIPVSGIGEVLSIYRSSVSGAITVKGRKYNKGEEMVIIDGSLGSRLPEVEDLLRD